MKKKRNIGLQLPIEIYDIVVEAAKDDADTVSSYIRKLILDDLWNRNRIDQSGNPVKDEDNVKSHDPKSFSL